MTPRRLEQVGVKGCESKGLGESPESSGALSGAEGAVFGDFDPDLQRVVNVWADLPAAVKTGILAMVQTTEQIQADED